MNWTYWMDGCQCHWLTHIFNQVLCLPSEFKLIQIVSKVFQSWVTVLMRKCVDVKPQHFDLWWDIDTIFMYFWLIDPLCYKGLQRWLGAARHSTIIRSDCEISANSSVGLGASLSLAPFNNVTQMPFFVSLWAPNDHYTTESCWEWRERGRKRGEASQSDFFERCEMYFENKYEQVIIAWILDCSREHVRLCAPAELSPCPQFLYCSIGIPPELSPHNDGILPPSF